MESKILEYVEGHKQETVELLKKITSIPAPSHNEKARAEFINEWLLNIGAENVEIDEALNVIYAMNDTGTNEVVIFMAHEDTVFPDLESIVVTEKDGRLFAPGIGDNASNLTNMLMSVKFLLENGLKPKDDLGIIFVASSCEEGLGNLKGCKAVCERYSDRIKEFIALDGNMGTIVNDAVGSHRYKVSVFTEGGHSYGAFGNRNAIHYISSMIQALYMMKVPDKAKTTYNVGKIEGGTSVNTIAENASMLYEFRSSDHECLEVMESFFNSVIDSYSKLGIKIEVETLGIRPCKQNVNEIRHKELEQRSIEIMKKYCLGDVNISASSTDSNIPLSMGIPAVTYGTVRSKGAHTRGENLEIASLVPGQNIAIASMLYYLQ